MSHRIRIARAEHKFSCAHMTVFPDGTKERLHGHNYTLALTLELARVDLPAMVPFAAIKAAIAAVCAAWRERVLIAARCPFLTIARDDHELELTLCGARYVFPRGDVLLLPIDNVSVEALADHAAGLLAASLTPIVGAAALGLEVEIEESPGQGASAQRSFGPR